MKSDSQADELAEQWTLLPRRARTVGQHKRDDPARRRSALKFFRCEGRFPQSPEEVPERRCQLGPYFAPGDTNVFARPTTYIQGFE